MRVTGVFGMLEKVKTLWSCIFVLLVLSNAQAYSPVVTIGAGGYAGYGSAEPDSWATTYGPGIDVDFRTAAGDSAYLAAWYSGQLWFSPESMVPEDQQDLGVLVGANLGAWELETKLTTALSTRLGDSFAYVTPRWSVSADLPIESRANLEIEYSGLYNHEYDASGTQLTNALDLGFSVDPSLEFGLAAGISAFIADYPDLYLLDSSGLATATSRRDIGVEGYISTEGLVGFFSVWETQIAGGLIESNANRYLAGSVGLEPDSEDEYYLRLDSSLDSSLANNFGIVARIGVSAMMYPDRRALDSAGDVVSQSTLAMNVKPSIDLDWNPFGSWYLRTAAGFVYGRSNDFTMTGWNTSGTVSVEYRL
jgi:hypothetical protein